MSRPRAGRPASSRLALAAAGLALVALVAVWLATDDAGSALAPRDGARDAPRPMDLAALPAEQALVAPSAFAVPAPLAPPRGRLVPVDRIDPVLAYERTVLLAPEGDFVASRVVDPDGRPVAGARVLLYEFFSGVEGGWFALDHDEALTDSDGRFELHEKDMDHWFGSSWTDDWRIAVLADGHVRWHGMPVAAGASNEIVLPRALPITLELRSDDGAPVVDAFVREHVAQLDDFAADDEEVVPYWTWGRTDAAGRLDVLLPDDFPDPLVHIEHPDHLTTVRLPAAGDDGVTRLVLPRNRAVDVVWTGDLAAWNARGLSPPLVSLDHPREPETFSFGGPPDRFVFGTRSDDSGWHFEHLSDEPVVLHKGWNGPVLVEEFVPPPGRTRIELPLPAFEPFEPGTSSWGVRVTARSTDPELVRVPRQLVARAADGLEQALPTYTLRSPSWTPINLAPPVTIFFVEWGPGGPRAEGVGPGDVVELVVDAAQRHAWSADIRLDVRFLDPLRAANARLIIQRGKTSPRGADQLAAGLPADTWTYRVRGDGIEQLDGTVTLAVGDELVLEPLPAPLAEVDPRPLDRREPHALLIGTARCEGDPWAYVDRLRLRPASEDASASGQSDAHVTARDGTITVEVRGGAFRDAVPPGSYDVEILLGRSRYPASSLDRGYGREDEFRVTRSVQRWPGSPLVVADGETREVALVVPAGEPRGLVLVHPLLDGATIPERTADGFPAYAKLRWTPRDAEPLDELGCRLTDGLFRVSLPPGEGVLRIAPGDWGGDSDPGDEPLAPVDVPLVVPPAHDADGRPQALEIDVELRPARGDDDAPR